MLCYPEVTITELSERVKHVFAGSISGRPVNGVLLYWCALVFIVYIASSDS